MHKKCRHLPLGGIASLGGTYRIDARQWIESSDGMEGFCKDQK